MRGISRDLLGGGVFVACDDFVYRATTLKSEGSERRSGRADISDALLSAPSDALLSPATSADALFSPADPLEAAAPAGVDALTLASFDPMTDRMTILPNTLDYWW